MLLSSRLSLPVLIELCRVLRHNLGAGLTLLAVFRQQQRRGPAAVRALAGRVADLLEKGHSLGQALKREANYFPPLFLSLTEVGEQTGMLPEVFADLERYYIRQRQLRNQFVSQITWPIIELTLAVLVVAGVILVMGLLPGSSPGKPAFDPLGLGLAGPSGALIFLGVVGGVVLGGAGLYLTATRLLRRGEADAFLLGLPALGPCLRTLALARFCMALRLTSETGMPVPRAIRLAMRATGNEGFAARSDVVEQAVRAGSDLTAALAESRRFPQEFLDIMANGEEAGRLSEVLQHQADHYHEEAGRRLAVLTRLAGGAVWLVVAGLIIVVIFRIFGSYLSLLDSVGR